MTATERNGDHFRELREILTAPAPASPQEAGQ